MSSPTALIARLPLDQLGGARVFRPCTVGGKSYRSGEIISAEVLRAIKKQNLKALMDQRFLVVWPTSQSDEVFVFNRHGTSNYDVVVGRIVNDAPLSKAEAEQLAESTRKRPEAAA